MTARVPEHRPMSVEEYLRFEDSVPERHELVAGEVYALAGVTPRHNRIAGNIFARLCAAARDGPCRVYMSDVKLRAAEDVIYYPDIMVVVCEPGGEDAGLVHGPCLVIEVTSPSTARVDRG